MKFNRPNLIRSIGKKWAYTLDDFTETNQTGIFRHIVHSLRCPDTGTRRRVTFFHVTKPGKVIKKPPEGHIFKEDLQDHGTIGIRKRRRLLQTEEATEEATTNSNNSIESQQRRIQQLLLLESRWHSPEYKKLFGAKNGEAVGQCLDRLIALMAHANSKVNAWRDVIDTHDKDGLCTNLHIHTLRQKCQLLGLAYRYARLTMNQFAEYGKELSTWNFMSIPVTSCTKKLIAGFCMVECSLYVAIKTKMLL